MNKRERCAIVLAYFRNMVKPQKINLRFLFLNGILLVRNSCGGNQLRGGVGVNALVIKKDIGTERFQNLRFFNTAEEENLVDSHVPCP